MEQIFVRGRLRLLLDHFSDIADPREPAKVKFPLPEVLFLVSCATIAGCDDYDEIADWVSFIWVFCGSTRSITSERRKKTGCGRS